MNFFLLVVVLRIYKFYNELRYSAEIKLKQNNIKTNLEVYNIVIYYVYCVHLQTYLLPTQYF